MKRWFMVLSIACATTVVFFLLLPLVALFLRIAPGDLVTAVESPVARDALWVSFKTSLAAHLLILGLGTPAAYFLATRRFRGRDLLIALVDLPLVLPPVVAGIALLSAFGRRGLLGGTLEFLGVSISFTQLAVVLAIAFVASPFYIRQAIAAFEAVDRRLVDAARTLAASPWKIFRRISLPLASRGLAAGSALAFARGLGEFGATIIFAGSLQGTTQTLPLAIYAEFDHDFNVAISIGMMLVAASIAVVLGVKWLPARAPFGWTSRSSAATSSST